MSQEVDKPDLRNVLVNVVCSMLTAAGANRHITTLDKLSAWGREFDGQMELKTDGTIVFTVAPSGQIKAPPGIPLDRLAKSYKGNGP